MGGVAGTVAGDVGAAGAGLAGGLAGAGLAGRCAGCGRCGRGGGFVGTAFDA